MTKPKMLGPFMAIFLLFCWSMANGDLLTANELSVLCKNTPQETVDDILELSVTDRYDLRVCTNYILGARELWVIQAAALQKNHPEVLTDSPVLGAVDCTPTSVSLGQMIRIVKKWIRDNPEAGHLPAPVAIMRATQAAFCK